jgi:hypothetical protein
MAGAHAEALHQQLPRPRLVVPAAAAAAACLQRPNHKSCRQQASPATCSQVMVPMLELERLPAWRNTIPTAAESDAHPQSVPSPKASWLAADPA